MKHGIPNVWKWLLLALIVAVCWLLCCLYGLGIDSVGTLCALPFALCIGLDSETFCAYVGSVFLLAVGTIVIAEMTEPLSWRQRDEQQRLAIAQQFEESLIRKGFVR